MPTSTPTADGLLLADKPAGISSHDVVLRARRALGTGRVGHAGTLDPFATGLLVILFGRATRLLPYLAGDPKVYEATIRFGTETDSEDLTGIVTREAPPPDQAAVLDAIPSLTGSLSQMPPAFSAKRVGGERAYEVARRGDTPALTAAQVRVDRWEVLGWHGIDLQVRITCGGGTYIRSLARDLGRAVGSAAHLAALRRTAIGPFQVADANVAEAMTPERVRTLPALEALRGTPIETLDAEAVAKIVRGIDVAATIAGTAGALIDARTGALVAYAERRNDRWQPRVVMHAV